MQHVTALIDSSHHEAVFLYSAGWSISHPTSIHLLSNSSVQVSSTRKRLTPNLICHDCKCLFPPLSFYHHRELICQHYMDWGVSCHKKAGVAHHGKKKCKMKKKILNGYIYSVICTLTLFSSWPPVFDYFFFTIAELWSKSWRLGSSQMCLTIGYAPTWLTLLCSETVLLSLCMLLWYY